MNQNLNVRDKQEVNTGVAESTNNSPMFSPMVDIWETDTGLVLVADMPGVSTDDISVDLSNGTLTVNGRVAASHPNQHSNPTSNPSDLKVILSEYEVGNFYRQFSLADNIDQENITASMKDGVLKLELPRVAPTQPRKIKVQTSES